MFHLNLDEEELITKENVPTIIIRLTKSLRNFSINRMMKMMKFRDMLIQ
jgi:hypothetical protein